MKKNPKVSIVIPVYNGSKYMREAIDSALGQTYPNIEVIVVNDGSTDDTEEIALSYGNKVRYYSKENGGVSSALNIGLEKMTGEYFQFLPHDDILQPQKIEKQIAAIQASNQPDAIVWSGWSLYLQEEQRLKRVTFPYEHADLKKITKGIYPLLYSLITIVTVLFPKKYIDEVGAFKLELTTSQDYEMMFRTFMERDTIYLDEDLVHYRWHKEMGTRIDPSFEQNCIDIGCYMVNHTLEQEMIHLFGSKYAFYLYMLDRYMLAGWKREFEELLPKFISEDEPSDLVDPAALITDMLSLNNKKLVLYGAGKNAKRLTHYLKQRGIYIDYLCDRNEAIHGMVIDGAVCVPINKIDKTDSVMIVTIDNPHDVVEDLRKDGFQYVFSFMEIGTSIFHIIPRKKAALESWNVKESAKMDISEENFEETIIQNIKICRFIYDHLEDGISRELFRLRILYSLTGAGDGLVEKLLCSQPYTEKMLRPLLGTHKNYIYGAGKEGCWTAKQLPGYWKAYIDSSQKKQGTEIEGLKVFNPAILEKDSDYDYVVVTPTEYAEEIVFQLRKQGVPDNKIIDWGTQAKQIHAAQYFDLPFLYHEDDEIFIDAGGYDGMTAIRFARWAKTFKHIYIFEPDKDNFTLCKKNMENENLSDAVSIYNKGCWSSSTTLKFNSYGNQLSYVCEGEEAGCEQIEVVGIDEILNGEKATFIKMDIEGTELEALKGAEKTIKKWKPKLAICVYHKPEDIITISKLILDFNPAYKLYLRHYSYLDFGESVLYAI